MERTGNKRKGTKERKRKQVIENERKRRAKVRSSG